MTSARPARILVVEDEAIIAEGLRLRLTDLGFEVIGVTATGEDAIRQTTTTTPDLVLMDIRLGGEMDGIAAGRQIRAASDTPIVYLTANSDRPTVERAIGTSPFGYLSKPVRDETLRTTIEVALHKNRLEREYREREQRFVSTLASLGDALLVTDDIGRVTFLNPAASRITGWSNNDAAGKNIAEVLSLMDVAGRHIVPTDTALASGQTIEFSTALLTCRDNETTVVAGTAVPVESGGIRGVVVSLRLTTADSDPTPTHQGRRIIPTCASCRDIRDASGQWIRPETFFEREFPVQFSHGICLTCARRLYPDIKHFQEE
jgi:PAS domain S-box-containing protein